MHVCLNRTAGAYSLCIDGNQLIRPNLSATPKQFWRAWMLIAVAVWMSVAPSALALGFPVSHLQKSTSYGGERTIAPRVCIYLYANANPVGMFDPSGNISLLETASVGVSVGILVKIATVSYRAATGRQYETKEILRELAEGAGYGALGAVIGFYTNPAILSLGRLTKWYGVFGAGTISGTISASSVALFREFVDFYILNKPTTFTDSKHRVINATAGGFMTGGLFTVIRFVPKVSSSEVKAAGFAPGGKEMYIYTPYQYLGPQYYQELNDAAILGATPRTAGASVIEKIIRQGINFDDYE